MRATEKDVVATVLRKVADAIKGLDSEEWHAVVDGDFKVEIAVQRGREERAGERTDSIASEELVEIVRALNEATTREAGLAVLEKRCPSKENLVQLSRHLDIPVQRRDASDKMRKRIVETTIGFRLRSRAVQGALPTGGPKASLPPLEVADGSKATTTRDG